MSDYISDQLRAKAAELRNSTSALTLRQVYTSSAAYVSPSSQATRKAAAEQAQAAALAEWEQLRERIPETPEGRILRALLYEHRPRLDSGSAYYRKPACDHCDQIGGWERDGVDWPCPNYEIIREGMG